MTWRRNAVAEIDITIEYDPEETNPEEIRDYIHESFHHVDYVEVEL